MRAMCAAICSIGAPAPALPPPRRCLKMTGAAAHALRLMPVPCVRRGGGLVHTGAQAERAAKGFSNPATAAGVPAIRLPRPWPTSSRGLPGARTPPRGSASMATALRPSRPVTPLRRRERGEDQGWAEEEMGEER